MFGDIRKRQEGELNLDRREMELVISIALQMNTIAKADMTTRDRALGRSI